MPNFTMPQPPIMNNGDYQAYDQYGNPVQVVTYAPRQQYYQSTFNATPVQFAQPQQQNVQVVQQPQAVYIQPKDDPTFKLGADFSGLIGNNVNVPTAGIVTELPEKSKRKKKEVVVSDGKVQSNNVSTKHIEDVSNVIYADTFNDTTNVLRNTIAQIDELAGDTKMELDLIRSSKNMKGKYMYITNLSTALAGMLSTKIAAVREINNSIKASNDAEYRRYKDIQTMQAKSAVDDNKAIMDLYNAYINTPVGTMSNYSQPSTLDITAALNGVVPVENKESVLDRGFNNYINNLTPEQNAMLKESDQDIQEVIIYDQSTGKKYFEWINIRTGEVVPNMPHTDPILLEDYTIDPRTKTARNININKFMKVIYKNETDNF